MKEKEEEDQKRGPGGGENIPERTSDGLNQPCKNPANLKHLHGVIHRFLSQFHVFSGLNPFIVNVKQHLKRRKKHGMVSFII